MISNILQYFVCLHFYLNLHKFFHFFPIRITKFKKFKTKKKLFGAGGGGWGGVKKKNLSSKFTQIHCLLIFKKK